MRWSRATWVVCCWVLVSSQLNADVKPNGLFSDGAVLLRDRPIPVFGSADPDELVTVSMAGQTVEGKADATGRWLVNLAPIPAGGPHELVIKGKNTFTAKDILVGEVWVCSGQSNMQWPVRLCQFSADEIKESANPMLRLFTVPVIMADEPLSDVKGTWAKADPESIQNFSAVGYAFGRKLQKELKIPIGLIHSSLGGSAAEAWVEKSRLANDPVQARYLSSFDRQLKQYTLDSQAFKDKLRDWESLPDTEKQAKPRPQPPRNPNTPQARPAGLYNGMIKNIVPYGARGAIWYQGESNAGRAYAYEPLLQMLVKNWRDEFANPEFAFFIVQLAPFMQKREKPEESAWAELREAQRLAAQSMSNSGLAVITDLGDERDIHARDKGPVGERLALSALVKIYQRQHIVGSGPEYQAVEFRDGKAFVKFNSLGGGLVAKGDKLTGFAIAAADGEFFNAEAQIEGDTVVVSATEVKDPAAVRFGWANFPVVNLYNKAGLPASPFRTDTRPLTTAPKK